MLAGLHPVFTWRCRGASYPRSGAHGTNLRTHADLIQHYCGPTSAKPRNRFNSSISSFFSSSIYLWGTPRGPIPQPA